MISMSMPAEQVRKELFSEEQKAVYWLRKSCHGDKGYEQMRDELVEKCTRTMKTVISDVVEYISASGNRWMAFECCQYYAKAGKAYTMPLAFCYYETYGSVGAYFVGHGVYDIYDQKTVLHFTNHFFLRFCQRLGVPMRSRWMVQRFAEVIPGFLFGYNGIDDKGRARFDLRLPGSIGRGVMVDGILEVRTYLTDKELNGKQRRETERLRENYERQSFEPLYVRLVRLAKSEDFAGDMEREIANVSALSGIDRNVLSMAMGLRVLVVEAVVSLGYVRPDDRSAWTNIGNRTADVDFIDFVAGYSQREGKENARLLFDGIADFGRKAGIKGYSAEAVMDYVVDRMGKIAERRQNGTPDKPATR